MVMGSFKKFKVASRVLKRVLVGVIFVAAGFGLGFLVFGTEMFGGRPSSQVDSDASDVSADMVGTVAVVEEVDFQIGAMALSVDGVQLNPEEPCIVSESVALTIVGTYVDGRPIYSPDKKSEVEGGCLALAELVFVDWVDEEIASRLVVADIREQTTDGGEEADAEILEGASE